MERSVLVTGGAGYIGSHTCKTLSRAGYLPVAFDNLHHGHRSAVKWGPLEEGDIQDQARLNGVFERYRPIAVIHFAAFAYVGESVSDPLKYYRNNVVGSLSLLEAAMKHKIRPFVFSSTCATYGVPQSVPITEDAPQRPVNPYGATKLVVERMLADFDVAYGMKSVCLRYFNAAGADKDGEIGEQHDPETHLIPLALRAVNSSANAMTVFGNDYDTADGTAVRDYIHVEDLAAAHVAALSRLLQGGESVQVNVGTGIGASVLEVIEAAERASNGRVNWKHGPRRAGDPATLVADPSRLKETLGVDAASFQKLPEIVQTAWSWHAKSIRAN